MAKTEKTEKKNDARRVMTPTARGSYLHIFKPTTFKKKTSYSATLLFPKKGTDMAKLIAAKNAALRAQFGEDKTDWPDDIDNPIRDGDKPKFAKKEGYKGHWVVKASAGEEFKPGVFDEDGNAVMKSSDIVSGDYIRAQIYAIAYDLGEGSRGASFLLDGVQLVKKGKPLTARGELKFDPISGDDSGEEGEENESEDGESENEDDADGAEELDFT